MAPEEQGAEEAVTGESPTGGPPTDPGTAGVDGGTDAEMPELADEAEAASEVEEDLEALKSPEAKADEYLELAQRTQADFDNYRRRARQDVEAAGERGVARLAGELLGALDNFDHALAAVDERPDSEGLADVARGFGLIRDELLAGLSRCGVEAERPDGERFDPQFHEAIAHVPAEGAEPGTIVAVHQPGYRIGSTVIRAARVSVAGG